MNTKAKPTFVDKFLKANSDIIYDATNKKIIDKFNIDIQAFLRYTEKIVSEGEVSGTISALNIASFNYLNKNHSKTISKLKNAEVSYMAIYGVLINIASVFLSYLLMIADTIGIDEDGCVLEDEDADSTDISDGAVSIWKKVNTNPERIFETYNPDTQEVNTVSETELWDIIGGSSCGDWMSFAGKNREKYDSIDDLWDAWQATQK